MLNTTLRYSCLYQNANARGAAGSSLVQPIFNCQAAKRYLDIPLLDLISDISAPTAPRDYHGGYFDETAGLVRIPSAAGRTAFFCFFSKGPQLKSSICRVMSSDGPSRSSTESRELLRSTSFEIDDAEAGGGRHKYTNGSANRQNRFKDSLRQTPPWTRPRCIYISLALAAVLILGSIMFLKKSNIVEQLRPAPEDHDIPPPPAPPPPPPPTVPEMDQFTKPVDFKIVGLIFFGRPPNIAILDCYLKKNLVSNGGFLDEVHFVVNTDKEQDIEYLDKLVKTDKLYTKVILPELGYKSVWEHSVEPELMYIKIDDDI
ncbi:MAG: hypothetical protein Q9181_007868, partial [Wetmoreana brouardii]